jgi:hypothetical protein
LVGIALIVIGMIMDGGMLRHGGGP